MAKNGESAVEEKEERLQSRLRVIRERFERRLDENAYGGVREQQIYHGLKATSSCALHKSFADMCFCEETQEYLLLDRAVEVQRYSMQGKQLRASFPLEPSMTFTRMLCCGGQCLVGYDPDDELIWLLNWSCEPLQAALKNEFRTRLVHYEAASKQLVVVGSEQSAKFRLEDKHTELESSKPMSYSDSEFGPSWQLECSALLPARAGSPCRLIASYLSTLYLLALEEEAGAEAGADADADEPEDFLARRGNASAAAITALRFDEASGWILSGDQQGNVMAHNLRFECVMSREGAHLARVTMLCAHPAICGFLSLAADKLQVWSCNLRRQLECFEQLGGSVSALAVNPAAAAVVSLAAHKLSYLTMHQLYCFFAPLTSPAKYIDSTHNPMYPTKTIVLAKDNSVRLFSPDASQINVQILPEKRLNAVSAVYCANQHRLFTMILQTGEILVSDATVCPMTFNRSVFVSNGLRITSISSYELFDEIRNEDGTSKSTKVFYPISIRIFAGTDDGNLILINSLTGKHDSVCSAHCGSVIQIRASSLTHRLVSLGIDKCVKVWRIMADLAQPLHLFYELYFTVPVIQVATMGLVLCVVNSSKTSDVHQLLMYNMADRERLEHRNADDHSQAIIDIITSESLTMCATSSLDKTIRIWSHQNCLINVLHINLCAWNIAFSSITGDIVFSAGRHLYKIPHESYLSPYYRGKISTSDLTEDQTEQKLPQDSTYNVYSHEVDRNLMLHPVSSLPLGSIDLSNSENPQLDLLIQKQICELIESRDEDIRKIKDYLVTPSKVIANRALMTAQAWDEYVNELLNSFSRAAPDVPKYQFQSIVEAHSKQTKTYNEPGVFQMLFGYSMDKLEDTPNLADLIQSSKLPLYGFLPNSILYKQKEPDIPKVYEEPPRKELMKYKYPSEFLKGSQESVVEKRESIRLSQLMMVESTNDDQETT